MKNTAKGLKIKLVSAERGFCDFDIENDRNGIHRACVRNGIQCGDIFNVYHGQSSKSGLEWQGNIRLSLLKAPSLNI